MSKNWFACLLVGFFLMVPLAQAEISGDVYLYLKDAEQNPITTSLDLRISLWNVYKQRPGDVDAEGNINESSPYYGWYQTSLTITPDEDGFFMAGTPGFYRISPKNDLLDFPEIGCQNAFLQVEYKEHGAPNTDYQIYDFIDDVPYNNVERLLIDSNSTYYTLDAGPQTNWNTFTLDDNNNATTEIKLQFGDVLNQSIQWSIANLRFELSSSLYINGSLTLNGDLDFDLNELVRARLENRSSAPTCNANNRGRIYFNTTDLLPYYCNATSWIQF